MDRPVVLCGLGRVGWRVLGFLRDAGVPVAAVDPQVAANNANYVRYASPNKAAVVRGLINAADLNNPAIYPPRPVMERLASDKLASPEVDRLRMQAWTAIKSGQ